MSKKSRCFEAAMWLEGNEQCMKCSGEAECRERSITEEGAPNEPGDEVVVVHIHTPVVYFIYGKKEV